MTGKVYKSISIKSRNYLNNKKTNKQKELGLVTTPAIPTQGRLRQENLEIEDSSEYTRTVINRYNFSSLIAPGLKES